MHTITTTTKYQTWWLSHSCDVLDLFLIQYSPTKPKFQQILRRQCCLQRFSSSVVGGIISSQKLIALVIPRAVRCFSISIPFEKVSKCIVMAILLWLMQCIALAIPCPLSRGLYWCCHQCPPSKQTSVTLQWIVIWGPVHFCPVQWRRTILQ